MDDQPYVDHMFLEILNKNFTYHPPFGDQPKRYEELRATAKLLAATVLDKCPASRERSLALTNIEQAVFWANAAIARNEANPDTESAGSKGHITGRHTGVVVVDDPIDPKDAPDKKAAIEFIKEYK